MRWKQMRRRCSRPSCRCPLSAPPSVFWPLKHGPMSKSHAIKRLGIRKIYIRDTKGARDKVQVLGQEPGPLTACAAESRSLLA